MSKITMWRSRGTRIREMTCSKYSLSPREDKTCVGRRTSTFSGSPRSRESKEEGQVPIYDDRRSRLASSSPQIVSRSDTPWEIKFGEGPGRRGAVVALPRNSQKALDSLPRQLGKLAFLFPFNTSAPCRPLPSAYLRPPFPAQSRESIVTDLDTVGATSTRCSRSSPKR